MEEATLHIRDILRVLWRWKWLIVLLTVSAFAGTYFHFIRKPPLYRATARLRVRPTTIRVGEAQLEESPLRYLRAREFVNTVARSIKSPRILAKVFADLELERIYAGSRDSLNDFISSFHVEPEIDSYLINLWWEHTDPELAQKVVNAVVDEVEQDEAERCQLVSEDAKRRLIAMVNEREKRLREAEDALREFEKKHAVASYKSELERLGQQVTLYEKAVSNMKLTLIDLESKWETIAKVGDSLDKLLAVPEIGQDSLVTFYRQKIENLKEERTRMLTTYAPTSREMKNIERRLMELQRTLEKVVRQKVDAIKTELERTKVQLREKENLLEKARIKEREFAALLTTHRYLSGQVETARQLYMQALRRKEQLETGGYSVQKGFEIDHRALKPQNPVWPNPLMFGTVAGLVGLLCAVGLAFLFEHLDDSVREERVVEESGAKFLGSIPRLRRVKELAVVDDPYSGAAEAFRALRLSLFSELGEGKTLLITSPGPQEGKTVCAVNIAAAIANWGKNVYLIDADLRHPRLHRVLNVDVKDGLSAYLTSDDSETARFVETRVPRLRLLAAGRPLANPSDLLAGQRMADMLKEVADKGPVIIDSPPLLGPADSFVLARQCDAVVLVLLAGKTKVGSLHRAVAHLKSLGVSKIFAIINRTTPATSRYYYRYYRQYSKERV